MSRESFHRILKDALVLMKQESGGTLDEQYAIYEIEKVCRE
jgi:hypothetical protein